MADFLLGHEFDEIAVVATQARGFKVAGAELGQTKTEEVEFEPFLVQAECLQSLSAVSLQKKKRRGGYQRLIVKITLDIIHRRGVEPDSSGRHIRRRLGVVQVSVARVCCSTGFGPTDGDAAADFASA